MKKISLSSFNIKPIISSAYHLDISDEEYFGPNYRNFISNSKLKLINPDQGGTPESYKNGLKSEDTASLRLGSAIHELFLQSESFRLCENLHKPTAKLGEVIDRIRYHRSNNETIWDSIHLACKDVKYYVNGLTLNRIRSIIKKGLEYYINSKYIQSNDVVLSDKDTEVCKACLSSLHSNKKVVEVVKPNNEFYLEVETYNEDSIFLDIVITYKDKEIILRLKMKADNWTFNHDTKTIVLNDLKTTSKPFPFFMKEYGSFVHYHYARQIAMYLWMLKQYCVNTYNIDSTYKFLSNIIVVETFGEFRSHCYNIPNRLVKQGFEELTKLLKMVAYYEIYGYEEIVEFV